MLFPLYLCLAASGFKAYKANNNSQLLLSIIETKTPQYRECTCLDPYDTAMMVSALLSPGPRFGSHTERNGHRSYACNLIFALLIPPLPASRCDMPILLNSSHLHRYRSRISEACAVLARLGAHLVEGSGNGRTCLTSNVDAWSKAIVSDDNVVVFKAGRRRRYRVIGMFDVGGKLKGKRRSSASKET